MFSVSHSKLKAFFIVLSFLCIAVIGRHFFIQPLSIFSGKSEPVVINMKNSDCDFRVIGHRGNSYTAPEDTVLSIDEAFNVGANMVEVDVRLNRDGVPVLMHDALLDRTTNGSGPISQWTMAMLKTLDAGSWKGSQFKHVKVPSLAEAIQATAGRGPLYLDIKVPNLHNPIAKVIKENNFPPDSIYPAVNSLQMLKQYHEALPDTPMIWFRDIPKDWNEHWFDLLIEQGVVGFELYWSTVQTLGKGSLFLRMIKDKGLELWTYTLNGKQELQLAVNSNVNGIETDRPSVLHDIVCAGADVNELPLSRTVGLWDFNEGNLEARLGSNLRHWGTVPNDKQKLKIALASEFKLPLPGNEDKHVLFVPEFGEKQAVQMAPGLHHLGPGSGYRINRYSLLIDLFRPKESEGKKQALLQTHWNNRDEAEIYIKENGSVGSNTQSVGMIKTHVWHRLVVVVDLLKHTERQISVFIDGELQGMLPGGGVDGYFSVESNISNRPLLLFSDEIGNSESLYVSKIQLFNYALSQNEVEILGAVGSAAH